MRRIYRVAEDIMPGVSLWPSLLARQAERRMRSEPLGSLARRQAATEALGWLERRDALIGNTPGAGSPMTALEEYFDLRRVARKADIAEEASDSRAENWAVEALRLSELAPLVRAKLPHPGEVYELHLAHVVLGRVALSRDEIEDAEEHLFRAADALSSRDPVIASLGPNMTLAQQLLKYRREGPVVAFLQSSRAAWLAGGDQLDTWIDEINRDALPDLLQPRIYDSVRSLIRNVTAYGKGLR